MYIRDDIPSKYLNDHIFTNGIESILLEINLRNKNWLLYASYNPKKRHHLEELGNKDKEKVLRIVYKDKESDLSELLARDNSFTVHERNVQVLANEIY